MKYDFTSIMDRLGKDAAAVDGLGTIPGLTPKRPKEGFDIIPMWIADMNFPVVPSVTEALMERVSHPAFGYFFPSASYYESIIAWQETRNQVKGLTPECIGYENGVIGGVLSALRVFCLRGDKVLLHSPTYTGFTWALEDNGYRILHSPLKPDENGIWRMDYEDMERKLAEHKIHAAVLCSPHNPTGRVWEQWELEKVMELFKRYDVMVVSDEIWSDLTLEGYRHIPSQSVSEDARNRTVALYAPSKTFNLAGLSGGYHIIYNKHIREQVDKAAGLSRYNEVNVLSMHALIGAYSRQGREWVDELRHVLTENVSFAISYTEEHFEGVTAVRPQGTYMVLLDCTRWCEKNKKTLDQVLDAGYEVGIAWQDGRVYHCPCHIRLNLALPLSRIQEAFCRMNQYVFHPGTSR